MVQTEAESRRIPPIMSHDGRPFHDVFQVPEVIETNPHCVYECADALMNEFGQPLSGNDKPNLYFPPIASEGTGSLSVRQDLISPTNVRYTFVELTYQGTRIVNERDILAFSQSGLIGIENPQQIGKAAQEAYQTLVEICLYHDQERRYNDPT